MCSAEPGEVTLLDSTPVLMHSTSHVPHVVLGCQVSQLLKHLLCTSSWDCEGGEISEYPG